MGFRYFLIYLARKLFRPTYFLGFVLLLSLYFYSSVWRLTTTLADGRLHVRFLDVGQGDAVFITTAGSRRILIDGGPSFAVTQKVAKYLPWGDKRLDLILLSHPHADHVEGLTAILDYFKVQNIVFDEKEYETLTFSRFLAAVEAEKKEGARVLSVKKGDVISFGSLRLKILWPKTDLKDGPARPSNPNNRSIVSLLSYGDFDLYLPGDQETDEAEKMIKEVSLSQVEVLKVAHHGSRNGLSGQLLEALTPSLAVISAGLNNRYGHPHEPVLTLLKGRGIPLARTDLNGTIDVFSDGSAWSVKTEKDNIETYSNDSWSGE